MLLISLLLDGYHMSLSSGTEGSSPVKEIGMLGLHHGPEANWWVSMQGSAEKSRNALAYACLGFRDYLRPEGGDKSVIPLPPLPCMKLGLRLGLGLGLGLGFGVLNPNEPVTAN